MSQQLRDRSLRIFLTLLGIVFILGIWPLLGPLIGFRNQSVYEPTVLGVYATLGIFLLLAARAPGQHRSLILFTAWSSLVHAGIIGVQVFGGTAERWLLGDVAGMAVVGVVLLLLTPASLSASGSKAAA